MIWLSRSQTCTNKALDRAPRGCVLALRKRQSKDLGWWQSTSLICPVLRPEALPTVTAKGLSELYSAVVIGRPMTSDVFSLKMRGESTRNGWTSRISRPTCELQSIQMMSWRSGTQGLRLPAAAGLATTNVRRPASVSWPFARRRGALHRTQPGVVPA